METLKVLAVDDEPGMRLGVARVLKRFTPRVSAIQDQVAFEVRQAESGEQALEMIAADEPDLVLLDYKMPGMTGLDVLDRLAEGHPQITAIMLTAYASLETAISATKRGAFDFLAKPFTPDELKGVIGKAAERIIIERQHRKLAAEKRQVRFQFISVLAHELKSPLNAIEGYLHILNDGTAGSDPKVQQQMTGRCLDRIDGMRKMITDLLDLTRIESGQKKRTLQELDVVPIAQGAIDGVKPQADARGIAIELHAPPTLMMTGDRGELEIIMNNLVSNAVKYNRDQGRVDVRLSETPERARIEVTDTGIGMSKEECAKLFNDFVRIKNSKTASIPGSGLGLSIVKKLALLYDGSASVSSEPDVGSTFTIELMKHTRPAEEEPEAAAL